MHCSVLEKYRGAVLRNAEGATSTRAWSSRFSCFLIFTPRALNYTSYTQMLEITAAWLEFSFASLPITWIWRNVLSELAVSKLVYYPVVRLHVKFRNKGVTALALAGHGKFDYCNPCHSHWCSAQWTREKRTQRGTPVSEATGCQHSSYIHRVQMCLLSANFVSRNLLLVRLKFAS